MPLTKKIVFPTVQEIASVNHPGWKSGRYYGSPLAWVETSAGNHIINALNWQIFPVPFPLTVDAIGVQISTFSGSSVRLKLGIYNIANAHPTTKILDSGEISISSTGVKQAVFSPLTLSKGMYAIAFILGDANSALRIVGNANNRHPQSLFWHGSDSFSTVNYCSQNYTQLSSFGLPSDLSNITTYSARNENPAVLVRVAS